MRPPASLSSQVETTLFRRLATLKIQLQLGASCLISCSHAFFGSATLCCKTQTRLVKPRASSISRNSTSRQCQPATGNEALRVLGLQVPGILAWLRTTNCAGGSPGKLQEVLWPYSEPAFKGVGQPVRTLKLSAHEERSQETHEAAGPFHCSAARRIPRAQQWPVLCTQTSGFTLKSSRE